MAQAEPQHIPTASKDRRYSRIVWSLLALLLLCSALVLGLFVNRVRVQQKAISRIRDLGGAVGYDYQYHGGTQFDPRASPPGSRIPPRIIGRERLRAS